MLKNYITRTSWFDKWYSNEKSKIEKESNKLLMGLRNSIKKLYFTKDPNLKKCIKSAESQSNKVF